MSLVVSFLARFDAMNVALVASGFPPVSDWWRRQLERFLMSGRRQFVLRVGRRGGKSSTLCRLAVAWALWGSYSVPPGDVGVVAFVSVSRDESAQRLRTIEAILAALGVSYRRKDTEIEIDGRPVVFKTFAASVAGVSGFTSIMFIGDEVAKWRDSDTGSNPATEVLASARPTMATQPTARMFLCSSPLSTLDAHAEAFERGDTEGQLVASATTTEANPTVTEEQIRRDEPDERIRLREYYAIPQAAASSVWTIEQIERAMRPMPSPQSMTWHEAVTVLDMSSGRGDAAVIAPCTWGWVRPPDEAFLRRDLVDHRGNVIRPLADFVLDEHGNRVPDPTYKGEIKPLLLFWDLVAFEGKFGQFMDFDQLANAIAGHANRWGSRNIVGDQREEYALNSALPRLGLRFTPFPWTNQNKGMAVERLSRLLRDGMIVVPNDEKLKREMLGFQEKILPTGAVTWAGRADDRVAVLLTAMLADIHGLIRGSTIRGSSHRQLSPWEARL